MMKRLLVLTLVTLCLSVAASFGQTTAAPSAAPTTPSVKATATPPQAGGERNPATPPPAGAEPITQADIDRIIKKVTENERDFRSALAGYVFNRFATLQIIDRLGGQITGTYRRDSFMMFGPDGSRFEKILFAPVATTPPGFVTPEDLEDLGGVNPFALEPRFVAQYNFSYVGVERIDELNLYVFDVTPKAIPDPKSQLRLFTGRIWVDVDDLMIVKSKGKAVPETKKNKFPVVETTREQVDGKYWFPSDARSDDELFFDDGSVTKIRMRVKYRDYRPGHSDVRILDADEPAPTPTPSPTPKKPQ